MSEARGRLCLTWVVSSRVERTMKRFLTFAALISLALAGLVWIIGSSGSAAPEHASFVGYTNGAVGSVVQVSGNGAFGQLLLTNCTNSALFTITNRQRGTIWLDPFVIAGTETIAMLDRSDLSPIRLSPGQTTTVRVAVISGKGPWRACFSYNRVLSSEPLPYQFGVCLGAIRAKITRTPLRLKKHMIESDEIGK
jgi:hypothetical protein